MSVIIAHLPIRFAVSYRLTEVVMTPNVSFDARQAADTFRAAAKLNLQDPLLRGATLHLPGYGQAVMTGDLHGNVKNFEKLKTYAMLDRAPARHVILHEMVHAERSGNGGDDSHELLLLVARYKCAFPDQVHFLQSNHELAQFTGYPIAKNGRLVVEAYNEAVLRAYGAPQGNDVLVAMNEFIASFALAARSENGVWMSHSLPNMNEMDEFDYAVFDRPVTPDDLRTDRSLFNLVWGRRQTEEQLEAMAERLGVSIFITGHQPQEMGYCVLFDRLIILASDHNHGVFLPFDLARPQNVEVMVRNIRKFVAVG